MIGPGSDKKEAGLLGGLLSKTCVLVYFLTCVLVYLRSCVLVFGVFVYLCLVIRDQRNKQQ